MGADPFCGFSISFSKSKNILWTFKRYRINVITSHTMEGKFHFVIFLRFQDRRIRRCSAKHSQLELKLTPENWSSNQVQIFGQNLMFSDEFFFQRPLKIFAWTLATYFTISTTSAKHSYLLIHDLLAPKIYCFFTVMRNETEKSP